MKRYRVIRHDLDTRSHILQPGYADNLPLEAREDWQQQVNQLANAVAAEFGMAQIEQKFQNFADLGSKPLSLVSFHNVFLHQARQAFIQGNYYPSLTGICALGERVLNHLVLLFRDEFKLTPQYKKVYGKDSFDNWGLAIDTLEGWDILLPQTAAVFREFKSTRNCAIHFRPDLDQECRGPALKALHEFNQIISLQFASFGKLPWYLTQIRGASYVRKDFENRPFVKRVILPNCELLGHKARLEYMNPGWRTIDEDDYPDVEISDEDFAQLVDPR